MGCPDRAVREGAKVRRKPMAAATVDDILADLPLGLLRRNTRGQFSVLGRHLIELPQQVCASLAQRTEGFYYYTRHWNDGGQSPADSACRISEATKCISSHVGRGRWRWRRWG